MSSSVNCDLLLYADDSCLVCTDRDINNIENVLNKNFNSLCDWFVDNKLSIHLGEDKTKCIVFGSNRMLKHQREMIIKRGDVRLTQYNNVTYLGCILDANMSGQSMCIKALGKITGRLKFLYRKQSFLDQTLRRLLCNALIQPHFDYACSSWYPNLNKKLTKKLQTAQNKCIRFCLSLGNRQHIGVEEFKQINWLPTKERVEQYMSSKVYNFWAERSPSYMNEIFKKANVFHNTRRSISMLALPACITNTGKNTLSYLGPKIWNNMPSTIKLSPSVDSFKHRVKKNFFDQLRLKESDDFLYPLHTRGRFTHLL